MASQSTPQQTSQVTLQQTRDGSQARQSTVQRYLSAIGIDPSIPPRLYSFGLLKVLPIGEKRLAQLTAELTSAHPELIPTPDQCWLYQLALQLANQETTYDNLYLPRVEKQNATTQAHPSLLDSMRALTAEQTQTSMRQLTILLQPVEFSLLIKLYRDHVLQKTAARDLKISPTEATKFKRKALRKLSQEWHGLWQILTIDPRLSEIARPHNNQY